MKDKYLDIGYMGTWFLTGNLLSILGLYIDYQSRILTYEYGEIYIALLSIFSVPLFLLILGDLFETSVYDKFRKTSFGKRFFFFWGWGCLMFVLVYVFHFANHL